MLSTRRMLSTCSCPELLYYWCMLGFWEDGLGPREQLWRVCSWQWQACASCPTAQVRGAGFSKFTEDQRTLGGSQTRPAISLAVRVPWADSPAREWPWGAPVLTFLSRAVSLTTKDSRIHSGDYRSEFVTPCLLNHPWNDCSTKQETEATGSRSGSCSKTWLQFLGLIRGYWKAHWLSSCKSLSFVNLEETDTFCCVSQPGFLFPCCSSSKGFGGLLNSSCTHSHTHSHTHNSPQRRGRGGGWSFRRLLFCHAFVFMSEDC